MALRKDVKNPFPPESDEVTIALDDAEGRGRRQEGRRGEADEDKPDAPRRTHPKHDEKKPDDKKPAHDRIDFDGIERAWRACPSQADNYGGLSATKTGI